MLKPPISSHSFSLNDSLSRLCVGPEGKWLSGVAQANSPLPLNPLEYFGSGEPEIFPKLEMRNPFDPTPTRALVYPRDRNVQKLSNFSHREQIFAIGSYILGRSVEIELGRSRRLHRHFSGWSSDVVMRSRNRRFNVVNALLTQSENASEHRRSHNSCKHGSQNGMAEDVSCTRLEIPSVEMIALSEKTAGRPQLLQFFMTPGLPIPFVENCEKFNEFPDPIFIN